RPGARPNRRTRHATHAIAQRTPYATDAPHAAHDAQQTPRNGAAAVHQEPASALQHERSGVDPLARIHAIHAEFNARGVARPDLGEPYPRSARRPADRPARLPQEARGATRAVVPFPYIYGS